MKRENVIVIWDAFPNTIFVFTSEAEFWKVLRKITGFKSFSTYYYPDGHQARQAIFPSSARRRIEKLWSEYSKNRIVDNQRVMKTQNEKSDRRALRENASRRLLKKSNLNRIGG